MKGETNMKNKVIIYSGCFEKKERIELVDFTHIDHIEFDGVAYLRVLCETKYYYFKLIETTIAEVIIY